MRIIKKINNVLYKLEPYTYVIARIGISLVFVWFGFNQFLFYEDFLSYLPSFLINLSYAKYLIYANGAFDLTFGSLLLFGKWIRPVAALMFLHVISIVGALGYNDIAIRDLGLAIVLLAIAIGGKEKWTLK